MMARILNKRRHPFKMQKKGKKTFLSDIKLIFNDYFFHSLLFFLISQTLMCSDIKINRNLT